MARFIVAVFMLAALWALPASAQDARPTPAACAPSNPDPTGDAQMTAPLTGGTGQPAPDNFDLTQGFFALKPSGSRHDVTANFQVVNLDKTMMPGWDGMGFWVFYLAGDVEKFVLAATNGGDWTYYHGTQGDDGYLIEGETKGAALEGKDGFVEIVVPGALNRTLGSPRFLSVSMAMAKGDPLFGNQPLTYSVSDSAPDGGGGEDFVAKPCGTEGAGGGSVVVPTTLSIQAPKLKASKLKKGKRFSVGVRASGEVKKLTATLMKGRRAVATGKLAALSGAGKIALKLKRTAKKGRYSLKVAGTDASGRAVSASTPVRVR